MGGFPKCNHDVDHAEPGNRSAKPVRRDSSLDDRKSCAVRNESKQIILRPVAKQRVPRRQDQIETKKSTQNDEKNDGQFFNNTDKLYP